MTRIAFLLAMLTTAVALPAAAQFDAAQLRAAQERIADNFTPLDSDECRAATTNVDAAQAALEGADAAANAAEYARRAVQDAQRALLALVDQSEEYLRDNRISAASGALAQYEIRRSIEADAAANAANQALEAFEAADAAMKRACFKQ